MSLTLTILRHGDTFAPGEVPRRIGARTDLPLVATGEAQAEALGRAFARDGLAFDRVLVAPLHRTRATAERVVAMLSAAPEPEAAAWLTEIDHGPDEGLPEGAVLARIGAEALTRWNDTLVPPPGWIVDTPGRLDGWRALMAAERGHMLLVTSNGAARFALAADARLAGAARALPSRKLRTGAWGRLVRDADGWRIAAWDQRP